MFQSLNIVRIDGYTGSLSNFRPNAGGLLIDITIKDPKGETITVKDMQVSIDVIKAAWTFGGKNPGYGAMVKSLFDGIMGVFEIAKGGVK